MEIIIKDLNKSIDGKQILSNICLHIKSGEVFSLVGPNGAGKTTLIRILLNLYKSDTGFVTINGVDVKSNEFNKVKENIGFVLDNIGLFKDLTAEENLEFFFRIYKSKIDAKTRQSEIDKLLKLVKLHDEKSNKVIFFSRGMKQRLAIARSLINEPKLIILDEPLRGLDLDGMWTIRKIIQELSQKNCTVFINSHNLDEVERCSNHVAFINQGKIIEDGNLEQLRSKYQKEIYIVKVKKIGAWIEELKNLEEVDNVIVSENTLNIFLKKDDFELFEWFSKKNIIILELKKENKNLENIYLDIIGE
ncbi:MAG: ABC transporter ATP-binding protein [Clostridium sp.]|uniref:ABC transporter ATP-binding protein n=1 Tax=Clostridium sp. TaxID=1506 RepID=UPI003D6D5154